MCAFGGVEFGTFVCHPRRHTYGNVRAHSPGFELIIIGVNRKTEQMRGCRTSLARLGGSNGQMHAFNSIPKLYIFVFGILFTFKIITFLCQRLPEFSLKSNK